MNKYKIFRRSGFFVFGLIFFRVFFVDPDLAGQPNGKLYTISANIDFRLPLEKCFQIENGKILPVGLASDNNNGIFIGLQGGKTIKFDARKKSTVWTSELGGEIMSNLIYEDNKVFLVTKLIGEKEKETGANGVAESAGEHYLLWAIEAETGITIWQFPFTANGFAALIEYQYKLFLTTDDGAVISVNKFDGKKIFNNHTAYKFGSVPIFSINRIYIGADDNSIFVLSADNAQTVSRIPTFQSPATNMLVSGNNLYWGEKEGYVNSFSLLSKNRLWSIRQGGEISSLTLISNGILASSLDNFVYLISPQKGKRIWKKRLAGRILFKPLLAGDFVVFVTGGENGAVVLDTKDGKIVNKIYFGDNDFILSTPLIIRNLIVFPTIKGISAFAETGSKCS